MYNSSNTFPSLLSNKKKGIDYHKSCVESIIGRSLGAKADSEAAAMQALYDLFDGSYDIERFKYLMDDGVSGSLPATWQTINKTRPKLKVLIGELMERGYDFQVKAINKDAKVRALEAKEQMRVDMKISPAFQELSQYSGLPDDQGELPEDEEELDEFFDKNYKEEAEIVMYYALKYLDKRNKWGVKRMELFRDMLISGKAIVRNEIFQGLPRPRRVDPRHFIHDTWADGDMLEDATYFGELRYMSIPEAVEEFGLTQTEIEQAQQAYSDYCNPMQYKTSGRQHNFQFFDANKSATNKWFKESPHGTRILVAYACWVDYKKIKHKISEDKYGNEHIKRVSDAAADKEEIVSKNIKIWRQATVIGGSIVKNWGEVPNQTRDLDNLAETDPPYTVLIPDFVNGRSVSLAEQLQGLQFLKDIITYQIQLAMARAGAKGFVYDTSQLPDGWEVETAIKYLKTVGIAFINSKQGGTPSQFNQFQSIDLTLSQSVGQYLELSRWIDSEMDAMTGINEARQGVMQGASQAVGVTRSALLQSSLTTAPFFKLFDEFSSKVWNTQAKLVKITWTEKERFAPIIGDAGVDFINNDIGVDLNDYGIFVEATPKLLDDLSSFQSIIMAGLQTGQVPLSEALILLTEKDVISGIRRFEKMQMAREEQQMQDQMAMQQQQQQAQLQAQQEMQKFNMATSEQAAQRAQQTQQIKNQGNITEQLMQLRADLILEKAKSKNES